MNNQLLAYYIGILIVFSSHVYSLVKPLEPIMTMTQHSYVNLIAVALIAYYFVNKEGILVV